MARALVHSGRLPQFKVFNELRQQDETAAERESTWAGAASEAGPSNVADPARPVARCAAPLAPTAHIVSCGCRKGFYPAQEQFPL